jgi:CheY-like chemotaxis protein
MKYVFVLEDDKKFQREICESLLKVDPTLQIRIFETLKSFSDWVKLCAQDGPLSLSRGGDPWQGASLQATSSGEEAVPSSEADSSSPSASEPTPEDQLALVVSKEEFFGSQWMSLIRKTRLWLIKKKVCTVEDPTSLVITAFHSPLFDIRLVEDRIINNIIFKPFDRLILEQHLNFAVSGRHPPASQSLYSMKTKSTIEMLKDIQMEALSEVGMLTLGKRKIKVGSVSKYYSDLFKTPKHRSIIAICQSCEPHPQWPSKYLCEFRFFSPDPVQISNFRKLNARKNAQFAEHQWFKYVVRPGPPSEARVQVIVIEPEENEQAHISKMLRSSYTNVNVTFYRSPGEFLYQLDPPQKAPLTPAPTPDAAVSSNEDSQPKQKLAPLPSRIDLILCDEVGFEEGALERWQKVRETIAGRFQTTKVPLVMLSSRVRPTNAQREIAAYVDDIFIRPLDPLSFIRRIKLLMPELACKKPLEIGTVKCDEKIQSASPIQVEELSEAGLVLKYYRPIEVGSFRKFILWREAEVEIPELLGACNYRVEGGAEGNHLSHFVFFGVTDHDLKHIRKWLLDNYIKDKEAA